MPRETVVYAYSLGWWHCVVASTTKKAAREAFGITAHEFSTYVSDTGNDDDIAAALANPGVGLTQPLDARGDNRRAWWFGEGWRKPWEKREPDFILP